MVELTGLRRAILLLLLALAAGTLSAQETSPQVLAPRRLLLVVAGQGNAGLSPRELTLASRSLLLALQSGRQDLVLVEPAREPGSTSDGDLSRLAGESGADCWILVEISDSAAQSALRVRSFDVLSSSIVVDRTIRRTTDAGLSVASLPNERWEDVLALLSGAYPPRAAEAAPVKDAGRAALVVRALPGTVVTLTKGAKGRATVGADGSARLEVPAPLVCELRAAKSGYLPVRQAVYVRGDRDLVIGQEPAPRLSIDASMLMAWPGVAVLWAPVPEWFFVRAGLTTYLLGFVMREDAVFTTDPFSTLDVLAGVYLNTADNPVRFYAGAGGFVRFVHAPNMLFGVDPLAPVGLQAVIGAETRLGPSAKFFLEIEPMLYATRYPLLLLSTQDSTKGWFIFSQAALQINSVRVGARWPL